MKKALLILTVMFVAAGLFAASGVTVKLGPAFTNFKTTVPTGDNYEYKIFTSGNGIGGEVAVQYDMGGRIMFFYDVSLVLFKDATAQYDVAGAKPVSVKKFYGDFAAYEKNEFYFNYITSSIGVAKRLDFNAFQLAVGGGLSYNRLWLKSSADKELGLVGVSKVEFTVVDSIIGLTAYVEGKFMIGNRFGISLTAAPQIGLYNRHSQTQVLTYTTASPATSVTEKPVSDFAVSYAIPVSLSVAYSF